MKKILLIITIIIICVLTAFLPVASAQSGYAFYIPTPISILVDTSNFGAVLLETAVSPQNVGDVYRLSIVYNRFQNSEDYITVSLSSGATVYGQVRLPGIGYYLEDIKYVIINLTYETAMIGYTYNISYQFITIDGTDILYNQGDIVQSLGSLLTLENTYFHVVTTPATVPGSYLIYNYADLQALLTSPYGLDMINEQISDNVTDSINNAYDDGRAAGYNSGFDDGRLAGIQEAERPGGWFFGGLVDVLHALGDVLWGFLAYEIFPGMKLGYITLGVPLLIGVMRMILTKIFGGKDDND